MWVQRAGESQLVVRGLRALIVVALVLARTALAAEEPWTAPDLNPVTVKPAPAGEPLVLVQDGQPRASIVVTDPQYQVAAQELASHLELATGAKVPIVPKAGEGLVVILTKEDPELGLVAAQMKPEGFAIKTAPGRIVIAGPGVLWGVYEFLERFVGVRWYFPGDLGRSVPKTTTLSVPPVWLEDAPVLQRRENWPPNFPGLPELHRRLRQGGTWPHRIACHTPIGWGPYFAKEHPEYFQQRADGTRDLGMLCYGNPATLEQYLKTIEDSYAGKYVDDKGKPTAGPWGWFQPDEHVISVSPNDAPVTCYCDFCRKNWDDKGGMHGEASKIVADFVARLAARVKERWPDKTVTYLAYANYTLPPAGITFPGNVEVHVCGMRGIANYKEPEIARSEQEIIDGWYRISGHPLQNWHYSCWPDDSTTAPYLFPHVVQAFYGKNRGQTVGTFINGSGDHWPRHHVSLYAWMRVMWNPDFPVDAAIDEYCRRMYGPAAATMRELVQLQMDAWEKSRWSALPAGHNVSPKSVLEESFTKDSVAKMEALLAQARQQAAADELVTKRIAYYAGPLATFFADAKAYYGGGGRSELRVQKVGEDPVVDGQLTDAVWERATPVVFRRALDKAHPETTYPSALRAVWTARGVTFGFRLTEPEPAKLVMERKGRDDGTLWWDDNVELFLDPTGQRATFFQWIITPAATIYDGSFARGAEWNAPEVKVAAHVGADFWSCEVFIPYEVFRREQIPLDPGALSGKTWYANFTRHRPAKPAEMQRLNTTFEGTNHNMMAFGPVKFVE